MTLVIAYRNHLLVLLVFASSVLDINKIFGGHLVAKFAHY